MKSMLLSIVLLTFVNSGFSQSKYPHFIKITYVNFSIETPFNISCNYFDNAFSKNDYKLLQIKKNSDLIIFANSFQKFVKVKSNGIDVRGKIEYILHGHKFKYCFDQFCLFSDGVNYYKNISLAIVLKKEFPDLVPVAQ